MLKCLLASENRCRWCHLFVLRLLCPFLKGSSLSFFSWSLPIRLPSRPPALAAPPRALRCHRTRCHRCLVTLWSRPGSTATPERFFCSRRSLASFSPLRRTLLPPSSWRTRSPSRGRPSRSRRLSSGASSRTRPSLQPACEVIFLLLELLVDVRFCIVGLSASAFWVGACKRAESGSV